MTESSPGSLYPPRRVLWESGPSVPRFTVVLAPEPRTERPRAPQSGRPRTPEWPGRLPKQRRPSGSGPDGRLRQAVGFGLRRHIVAQPPRPHMQTQKWQSATSRSARGHTGRPRRPAATSSRGSARGIPASCRLRSPGPWHPAPAWPPSPGAAGRPSAGPPPRRPGRRPPDTARCGPVESGDLAPGTGRPPREFPRHVLPQQAEPQGGVEPGRPPRRPA